MSGMTGAGGGSSGQGGGQASGSGGTGGGSSGNGGSGGNGNTGTGGVATGAGGGQSGAGTGGGGSSGEDPGASNPNADCAARSLLVYLKDISGQNVLSGQESLFSDSQMGPFPSRRDAYVEQRVDAYPALYSSDFGDFGMGNLEQRQYVVDNAVAYAERGSVIQLHYHMIQPDLADGSGFDAMSSFSSDDPYPAQNIDRMLTPGDSLQVEYRRRLDDLADYLEQLEERGIAVLWRPFHEMNGSWFWWGGQARFRELWVDMWEYLTNTRELDNLLWVFSVNYWDRGFADAPELYYPGDEYVDVVGVDVYLEYDHDYAQVLHDRLRELAPGKPIAFTENGQMPDIPALKATQPYWAYWATWWGFETANRGNTDALYASVYGDPSTLTQDEVALPPCP
jgi:mannan endo-1,4-beta-mannosidase